MFACTTLVIVLLIAHYLGWAFLQTAIESNPDGPVAVAFWGGQVASLLIVGGICLLGFRPGVTVTVHADKQRLRLEQGADRLTLAFDAIERAAVIDARRFYIHYRPYAATRIFTSSLPETVLLLRTSEAPVIVALASTDAHERLLKTLHSTDAPVPESTPATS